METRRFPDGGQDYALTCIIFRLFGYEVQITTPYLVIVSNMQPYDTKETDNARELTILMSHSYANILELVWCEQLRQLSASDQICERGSVSSCPANKQCVLRLVRDCGPVLN